MKNFTIENKSILVIDDMKLNFSIIKQTLEPYSHWELHYIQDPRHTTQFLHEHSIDLILLDYEMPYITGPELCQEIRSTPKVAHIPIVFFTASPSNSTIEKAFKAGADDYINKPVCAPELLARLQRIFHNQYLATQLEIKYQEQLSLTRLLSHDLNNYIGIISGTTATLKRIHNSDEDAPEAKALSRIQRTCDRMSDLVLNIRNIQAIEDNKMAVQNEKTPILEVLKESISNFEEKLIAKNVSVALNEAHLSEGTPLLVWAERTSALNSVFGNIISNAIKFSNRGKTIEVISEVNKESLVISIRDHGIGMDEALLKKVFSKTEKTSRVGTDNEVGTGFGMPLVKSFMEQYGGKIELLSSSKDTHPDDHGTTVKLTFKRVA